MYRIKPLFVGGLATLCLPVLAADELASFQSLNGYTGLINTPTAEVLDKGLIDFGYNNQLDLRGIKYLDGHNFIFSASLFDGFEASGLIATNSMHDNLFYSEGKGQLRDLSFNAKYQIPYIPKDWFRFAIGAKDIGGAANNYETYYAVASKELGDFRFSLGMGQSDRLSGQMDGAFAGIEWHPLDWFSLQVEHDGEAQNAAARITVPKKWLYDIGSLTLTSRFYSNSDFDENSTYWGVNFTMPFTSSVKSSDIVPAPQPLSTRYEAVSVGKAQRSSKNTEQHFSYSNAKISNIEQPYLISDMTEKKVNTQVFNLKSQLAKDGFENVLVGYNMQNQIIVRFENAVFNRNDIDALGLVLGRIAQHITLADAQFSVVLAKYDIPLMSVRGSVSNYDAFIKGNATPDLNISQGGLPIPGGVTWVGLARSNSPYFKPRVTFSPALTNSYATELGVYDFSLALRADVEVPLWQGAGVSFGGQAHVANSDDFDKNAPFRRLREETGIDRAVFYQTLSLPFGLYNQTQVGFYKETYDYTGITNETTWLSETGRHKVTANLGYFEYQNYAADRDYKTLSYQYNWVEKNITLHATAGDFWSKDSGAKVESRFWFGDSYLSIFLEDTAVSKVGIAFSIPLTPRKDMDVARYGQVKGNEAWRHSVSTQIGESHNQLVFNQGTIVTSAISLDRTFLNQGRLSSDYIYANLMRLKDAYIHYK